MVGCGLPLRACLRFHWAHSSLGISLCLWQECVPLSVGLSAEQSCEPQISGIGWPTGCSLWLCRWVAGSLLCTRQPSRWMLGQRRPQGWKSHQAAVPAPCTEKMKRTGTPGDTGQTLLHLHHPLPLSLPPNPNPFMYLFPSSLHLSVPLFSSFYRRRLHAQPARIWSVALGVYGPCLLNKGADWLIDRPSAVPAPHMFPSSLPHIWILCWSGLR